MKKISITRYSSSHWQFVVSVENKAIGQIWFNGRCYQSWYKVPGLSPQSFSRENYRTIKEETIKRLSAIID